MNLFLCFFHCQLAYRSLCFLSSYFWRNIEHQTCVFVCLNHSFSSKFIEFSCGFRKVSIDFKRMVFGGNTFQFVLWQLYADFKKKRLQKYITSHNLYGNPLQIQTNTEISLFDMRPFCQCPSHSNLPTISQKIP